MAWITLALIAALSTSLTTIFSKIGLKGVNSNFATFSRTLVVIIFSLILCLIDGSIFAVSSFSLENYLFLLASGLSTGLSWLCYFKALKMADVTKVAPIDKCSFVLTSILFLIFFFDSTTNQGNKTTIIALISSIILMLAGTLLMVINKSNEKSKNKAWIVFAVLSAVFASLVALFAKLGLKDIPSNVGTLFKTIVVCLFSLGIVLFKKDYRDVKTITLKSWIFLILSGIATGVAWLSEYASYNIENSNAIAINSIIKLSILLTMLFSFIFLKEKFTWKTLLGLALLTSGIVIIIIFSL